MNNKESGKNKGDRKPRKTDGLKPRELDGFENIIGVEGIEDEKGKRSRIREEIQHVIDSEKIVLPEIPPENEIARIDEYCKVTSEDEAWFDRTKKKDPEKKTRTVKMKKKNQ
jgi:hypothetical protein